MSNTFMFIALVCLVPVALISTCACKACCSGLYKSLASTPKELHFRSQTLLLSFPMAFTLAPKDPHFYSHGNTLLLPQSLSRPTATAEIDRLNKYNTSECETLWSYEYRRHDEHAFFYHGALPSSTKHHQTLCTPYCTRHSPESIRCCTEAVGRCPMPNGFRILFVNVDEVHCEPAYEEGPR